MGLQYFWNAIVTFSHVFNLILIMNFKTENLNNIGMIQIGYSCISNPHSMTKLLFQNYFCQDLSVMSSLQQLFFCSIFPQCPRPINSPLFSQFLPPSSCPTHSHLFPVVILLSSHHPLSINSPSFSLHISPALRILCHVQFSVSIQTSPFVIFSLCIFVFPKSSLFPQLPLGPMTATCNIF